MHESGLCGDPAKILAPKGARGFESHSNRNDMSQNIVPHLKIALKNPNLAAS